MSRLPIALTLGDPAGIGPEVAARVAADPPDTVKPVLVGRAVDLAIAAERTGLSLGTLERSFVACDPGERVRPGCDSAEGGKAAHAAVVRAVELARSQAVAGITTAPISKRSLAMAGLPFAGHTELLGQLAGVKTPRMVFVVENQRVALLTTHIPLREVANLVTQPQVAAAIRDLNRALIEEFGEQNAPIRVAALNPHLGEGGVLGTEERDAIAPAIKETRAEGLRVSGPVRPEDLFVSLGATAVEGVLALYHDQALGPLKGRHGLNMVNVTIGLPFVRTSPDHGTAYDIVGSPAVSDHGMRLATEWAARLWNLRQGNCEDRL